MFHGSGPLVVTYISGPTQLAILNVNVLMRVLRLTWADPGTRATLGIQPDERIDLPEECLVDDARCDFWREIPAKKFQIRVLRFRFKNGK
jgi:hypothetical protein